MATTTPTTTAPPASTAARILDAATNQFFERGFHGASMKELAEEAGIRSATLYYHFPNKEQLLVEIMRATLQDLTATVTAAVASQRDPIAALRAAVTSHILFHVERHREVFLCDAELRALSPDARTEVVALRDRYEEIFRATLRAGRDAGVLVVPDVELVTRSLLTSCSGVAFWFRPSGAMTVDEVAAAYVRLFLRALRTRT
jgi:AcrR family transcriptional regulator